MKPVVILRHAPGEGPGYFATFLHEHGIPQRLICVDQGEAIPEFPEVYSGIVLMGGPMSVNDDLPWIPRSLELIRRAVNRDVPVLGHCLGGQLISKALGGIVTRNPVREIGWGMVSRVENPIAHSWMNDMPSKFDAFHWHGETFTVPPGAAHILSSGFCRTQAFALGKHLGLQCHIEMTRGMVEAWCVNGADEIAANLGPSVQDAETMKTDLDARIAELNSIAAKLYRRWIEGLAV